MNTQFAGTAGMTAAAEKVPTPMHEDERLALDRETMVQQRAESLEGELREARGELQRLNEEHGRVANSYSRMLEATESHVRMLERALGYDQPEESIQFRDIAERQADTARNLGRG